MKPIKHIPVYNLKRCRLAYLTVKLIQNYLKIQMDACNIYLFLTHVYFLAEVAGQSTALSATHLKRNCSKDTIRQLMLITMNS